MELTDEDESMSLPRRSEVNDFEVLHVGEINSKPTQAWPSNTKLLCF
jgi:hypothetical protein